MCLSWSNHCSHNSKCVFQFPATSMSLCSWIFTCTSIVILVSGIMGIVFLHMLLDADRSLEVVMLEARNACSHAEFMFGMTLQRWPFSLPMCWMPDMFLLICICATFWSSLCHDSMSKDMLTMLWCSEVTAMQNPPHFIPSQCPDSPLYHFG